MSDARAQGRFAAFAWFTLAYTVAVILFGAWVRITGSGAGCGQHWPSCQGEMLHRPESVETLIELSHRVTSAADGLLIVALLVWSLRRFARGHAARRYAWASLVFVIVEGLVGAMLVRLELVADDDSALRAIVMSLHLVNTSLLTGALALTAWCGGGRPQERRFRWSGGDPATRRSRLLLLAGMVAVLLVMMSGAVTALGDTLYPVAADGAKLEALLADQSPTAHFLQRVRVFHPLLACLVTLYLLFMALAVRDRAASARVKLGAWWVIGLAFLQVVLGVVNIALSAPGWMQVVHLAGATLYWVVLLLFAAEATARPGREPSAERSGAASAETSAETGGQGATARA